MLNKLRFSFLVLLLLVLPPSSIFADFNDFFASWSKLFDFFADANSGLSMFPTLLIPMGGRYEGMATAYTAVADDAGLIEANPAGSAQLVGSELAFSHHNWIADGTVEAIVFVGRRTFSGLGIGGKVFSTPFTAYDSAGQRSGKGYFSEVLVTANASLNLVDIPALFSMSFGANLKGILRHIPDTIAADQSAVAFPLDIGALMRFRMLSFSRREYKNCGLGIVLRNLGPKVYPIRYPLPTILSIGIAYRPVQPLLLAIDMNVPISFESMDFPAENFDMAAGIQLQVARFLAITGGIKLKSDNPRISIGSSIDVGGVTFAGNYNVDLVGGLNPFEMFSLMATVDLGD
jgi:hypothetical protein